VRNAVVALAIERTVYLNCSQNESGLAGLHTKIYSRHDCREHNLFYSVESVMD